MNEAFAQAKSNSIAFAQRQLDAEAINEGDFDFYKALYEDATTGDELSQVTAQMMELIFARVDAMNELGRLLAEGSINQVLYAKIVAAIDEVHTASEVEKVMAELLFSKVEPGKAGDVIPATPINPDTNVKAGANNNKPGTTTSVNKPATGSTTAGSKGSAAKGSTTGSKDSSKQLPQTGEEVRNGLIAGGLASVLGGAALFFRKPRQQISIK